MLLAKKSNTATAYNENHELVMKTSPHSLHNIVPRATFSNPLFSESEMKCRVSLNQIYTLIMSIQSCCLHEGDGRVGFHSNYTGGGTGATMQMGPCALSRSSGDFNYTTTRDYT